jgi:hypothetical protein
MALLVTGQDVPNCPLWAIICIDCSSAQPALGFCLLRFQFHTAVICKFNAGLFKRPLQLSEGFRIAHGTGIDGEGYTLRATIERLGSGDMVLVHSRELV